MPSLARYIRQTRFALFGEESQRRLCESSALICGCGALGNLLASFLARAGVGRIRLVDADVVELTNLQRQVLFDEEDARSKRLKVEAAAQKLRQANSEVTIETFPVRATAENIEELCAGMDILLDATDNFETRFLLNEVAVKLQLPWVFGGCLGAEGPDHDYHPRPNAVSGVPPQRVPAVRTGHDMRDWWVSSGRWWGWSRRSRRWRLSRFCQDTPTSFAPS